MVDDRVSIVIPVYNHARYVGAAIESALAQRHPPHEVIVVDDGSTDETPHVIASFGRSVRAIRQENRGLSAARNTGIAAATGGWIALLDADDLYEPEFLDDLLRLARCHPRAAALYSGYRFVDAANHPLPQTGTRTEPPETLFGALLQGNFLVPECLLVRRDCYAQLGPFDEGLQACEDWDMWLRLAAAFPVVGTTTILTRHRILPGSMSSDPQRMLANRFAVLHKHFGSAEMDFDAMVWHQRQAYGRASLATAIEYLQQRQPDGALPHLRAAFAAAPELMVAADVCYELACGTQPKGWRGHFDSFDLAQTEALVLTLLERLCRDPQSPRPLRRRRRAMRGRVALAVGLLCTGAWDFQAARRYFWRALRSDPRVLRDPRFGRAWATAWLASAVVVRRPPRRPHQGAT